MSNDIELLERQVNEWRAEVSRLQGLIAFATKDSAPPSSLQQQLNDVGTGKIAHIYGGNCPDELEGRETRDPECPACQVLTRAALAVPQQDPVATLICGEVEITSRGAEQYDDDLEWHLAAVQKISAANPGARINLYTAQPPAAPVLNDEAQRLRELINTPELHDFAKGVVMEAVHQREKWSTTSDVGKKPADWFWLIGYLAQKAMMHQLDGNTDKALHHTITTAAALANWHAAIEGSSTCMRPGSDPLAKVQP